MTDLMREKLFNQSVESIFQMRNLSKYSALKQREDEFKLIFGIELAEYIDPRWGFNFSVFIHDFLAGDTPPLHDAILHKYGERAAKLIEDLTCIA